MGCNSTKQADVAAERERAPAPKAVVSKSSAAARAPAASAASPIRSSGAGGGREARRERGEEGAYELGKTPSDQHQREQDSFQELILRTQRNFIDMTQGSVGAMGSEDALERQRDVAKYLEESEAPEEEPALAVVPLASATAAADPLKVLQQACVTVEEEDALKMAAAAVARALSATCALKDVGKVVEVLPPIQALQ